MDPTKICPWIFLAPLANGSIDNSNTNSQRLPKPKTFVALLKTSEAHVQPNLLHALVVKGDVTCVHISQKYIQERLEYCRRNLFGRLLLKKGYKPMKPVELKCVLQFAWQVLHPWKLNPFLKGY